MMINVVVINAKLQERENLKKLLVSLSDVELCGIGKDGYDAVKLIKTYKPDIIMIDSKINVYLDTDILHLLKRISPSTAIALTVSGADAIPVDWILQDTPAACLLTDTDMDRLGYIVREIYSGRLYINPTIAVKIICLLADRNRAAGSVNHSGNHAGKKKELSHLRKLSSTEMQIFAAIAKGKSSNEIACCLNLKNGTIRNYISTAMRKAGLKNRIEIAFFARENGLVET
jgi:DNA-binding NarL/FixJ family response regulator